VKRGAGEGEYDVKLGRRPRAVIYDLDGVLLETEHFYTEVTQEIVGRYGKVFDWSVKSNMIGRPSLESARYLVQTLELPISAEDYLRLREKGLIERFPRCEEKAGAEAFVRALYARGIAQAVATSSEKTLFDLKTSRHGDWFALFGATVTGDDVRVHRGKPAPDIFLVAAGELGIEAGDCLVFEDAPAGVEAARAAGMQVIAVPDAAMDRRKFAAADAVIGDFREISPADLGFDRG
jgi:pseudouridine-5'-monophosphatase